MAIVIDSGFIWGSTAMARDAVPVPPSRTVFSSVMGTDLRIVVCQDSYPDVRDVLLMFFLSMRGLLAGCDELRQPAPHFLPLVRPASKVKELLFAGELRHHHRAVPVVFLLTLVGFSSYFASSRHAGTGRLFLHSPSGGEVVFHVGQEVYILVNPYGFNSKNIFGLVTRIDSDTAFGGGDLVHVRYTDPATGEVMCRGFREWRLVSPSDTSLLRHLAKMHREVARRLELLAKGGHL